jgi:hypothetical protein
MGYFIPSVEELASYISPVDQLKECGNKNKEKKDDQSDRIRIECMIEQYDQGCQSRYRSCYRHKNTRRDLFSETIGTDIDDEKDQQKTRASNNGDLCQVDTVCEDQAEKRSVEYTIERDG